MVITINKNKNDSNNKLENNKEYIYKIIFMIKSYTSL